MLLERKQLTSGTTWHAAGLVGQLRATHNLTRLAQYTTELYATLEAGDRARRPGFVQIGSLAVATNAERIEELKRGASMARCFGLAGRCAQRRARLSELLAACSTSTISSAACICRRTARPTRSTRHRRWPRARASAARGSSRTSRSPRSSSRHGSAIGVETAKGEVRRTIVVIAAGMWARELGRQGRRRRAAARGRAFLHRHRADRRSCRADLPVLRDADACAYYKEDAGKLLVGAFEPDAKPWGMDGIPESFSLRRAARGSRAFRADARGRHPPRADRSARPASSNFFNGPESFTPDDRYLLGETPEVQQPVRRRRLQLDRHPVGRRRRQGAGANGSSTAIRRWICGTSTSAASCRSRRNRAYLRDRTVGDARPALRHALALPPDGDGARRAAIRRCTIGSRRAAPASARSPAGSGRTGTRPTGVEPQYEYSYGRQNWFDYSARRASRRCAKRVGLFDQSSFAKFLVEGRDAETRAATGSRRTMSPSRVGRIVYTQWLNERGGIEADLTVTRAGRGPLPGRDPAAAARRATSPG